MSADLIARIRAAIDEDERIALAANPSPWRFRIPNAKHLDQNTIFGDGEPRGFDKLRQVCNVEMAWEREANAAHIVRHDPARVLRQVTAHRKILDEHEYAIWPMGGELCTVCREWPCTTIRAISEAYGIDVDAFA